MIDQSRPASEASARVPSSGMRVQRLFVSPGHNFFGRYGQSAGMHPVLEVESVRCFAGRGLEGDRFLDFKEDYKGQVTFFAEEVWERMCERFEVTDKGPEVFRRNILTRGIDLASLIGHEFEVQGVRFLGTGEAAPCLWMEEAFCPGAEAALRGDGGLRAKVLSDGLLTRG